MVCSYKDQSVKRGSLAADSNEDGYDPSLAKYFIMEDSDDDLDEDEASMCGRLKKLGHTWEEEYNSEGDSEEISDTELTINTDEGDDCPFKGTG